VRNRLKRKDLNVKMAETEKAQGDKAGIGEQQTQGKNSNLKRIGATG
jgi:hypothetical protein